MAAEANNGLGSEGAMQRLLNAVCLVVALCLSGAAAGQATLSPEEIAERRLLLQENRLKLDNERLEHEKSIQAEAAKKESAWTLDRTLLAAFVTAIAAYFTQLMIRRRDEKLQFQLKAAEIAMAGRDASQAVRRAKFLRALFSSRLAALDDVLEKDVQDWPYFGRSIEDRHEMLQLLAQYPGSRAEIIRAWEIMFPWSSSTSPWSDFSKEDKDAYRWFDELSADPMLNRNQPGPA